MEDDPRGGTDVKRARRPHVITNAERSPTEERRYREIRYLLMMSVRALCLVAAAVLISLRPPPVWLWLAGGALGLGGVPWPARVPAHARPGQSQPPPGHKTPPRGGTPAPAP